FFSENVYVNQDDIGSKSFLRLGDWSRYAFTKEVFKYMFNVLDESIARLQGEIPATSSSKTRSILLISSTIESIDDEINRIDLVL
ncbi:hypothetical protein ACUODJ_56585, partial [Escherichia sp. HC-CC]